MRKIKLIYVTQNCSSTNECMQHIYTIVRTKAQARAYINKLIYIKYQHHYELWCDVHNENKDDVNTFYKYLGVIQENPFDDYTTVTYKYSLDGICSVLRMMGGCVPLDLWYEPDAEIQNYLDVNGIEQKEKENS